VTVTVTVKISEDHCGEVFLCVLCSFDSEFESGLNAQRRQIDLHIRVHVPHLSLPLFIPFEPLEMVIVEMRLRHKELNERMHDQIEGSPPLIWVLLHAAHKVNELVTPTIIGRQCSLTI
jgi:hypothetical protein